MGSQKPDEVWDNGEWVCKAQALTRESIDLSPAWGHPALTRILTVTEDLDKLLPKADLTELVALHKADCFGERAFQLIAELLVSFQSACMFNFLDSIGYHCAKSFLSFVGC